MDPAPRFDWDPAKARANATKHGVTFEEASSIFSDPLTRTVLDTRHSTSLEDRWLTLGTSNHDRLLVVIHTDADDQTIRLISARPATRRERRDYERGLR